MKKVLLTLIAMACVSSAFAQGTIVFNNRVAGVVDARVYGVDPADQFQSGFRQGNPSTGVPAGTVNYDGIARIEGTGYTAQLFGGPSGTSQDGLVALTPTLGFRTGAAAGITETPAPVVEVTGVAGGQVAALQLRVWDNQGGTITSWDQVLLAENNLVPRGWSAVFESQALGNPPLTTPPNLIGLESFNLFIVPEPSTIALGVLGVGALLLFRRRKN